MRHIAVTGRDDISFTAHQGVVKTSHLVQTYPRSVPVGTVANAPSARSMKGALPTKTLDRPDSTTVQDDRMLEVNSDLSRNLGRDRCGRLNLHLEICRLHVQLCCDP